MLIKRLFNFFHLLPTEYGDTEVMHKYFKVFSFLGLFVIIVFSIQEWVAGHVVLVDFSGLLFGLIIWSYFIKNPSGQYILSYALLFSFSLLLFGSALFSGRGLYDDAIWGIPVVLLVGGLLMDTAFFVLYTIYNIVLSVTVYLLAPGGFLLSEYVKDYSPHTITNAIIQMVLIAYGAGFLGRILRKYISLVKNRSLELESTNQLLNSLINSSPLGIIVVDINNRVLVWNHSATRMFGSQVHDVLGKVFQPFGKLPEVGFLQSLAFVRKANKMIQYELGLVDMERQSVITNVFITPLPQNQADHNIMFICEDITVRRKSENRLHENEKALKKQNEDYLAMNEILNESNLRILKINEELSIARLQAEESDRLKTAFLANISHEVRTPLNAIMGFSEILKGDNLQEAKRKKYLDLVVKSGQQLVDIIDDVMSISRIDAGEVKAYFKPVKIKKILERLSAEYASVALAKGLQCILICDNNIREIVLNTDEDKLYQSISNLLRNAIKFTNAGSIMFGVMYNDNVYEFFVEDTGIGIAPEYHSIIFERFRQVEDGSRREFGGSGLGLTITKAYIEMMGGTIQLKSLYGKGSRFSIFYPGLQDVIPSESITEEFENTGNLFSGRKILIAEDQEINF